MKLIFTILFLVIIITSAFSQTTEDVVTGASYPDEVYYSLDNGTLKTAPRDSWDIAFKTDQMSVSVLANNGTGMMVYTWPNGTIDDWETVDTTGMDWIPMYNSIVDWEVGAFNANSKPNNADFDYGWGIYNTTNHHIYGDSIFIVKFSGGDVKKFTIVEKNASPNTWNFKYADLDGNNEIDTTFDADDFKPSEFAYYSIANNMIVEQEPAERWQLLFTRYYDYTIPYMVSGVLANSEVSVQQVNGVTQSDFEDYQTSMFNDTLSQIGSDWKSFNMTTFQYDVATDIVYFLQDTTGTDKSIWKLYFTGFDYTSGTYSFAKTKMNTTGINHFSERNLTVYPNPANQEINVIHDFSGDTEITIYNIAGQPVLKTQKSEGAGLNKNTLNISALPTGVYSLQVRSGNDVKTIKFLKD